jgi:hypothetical protein
MRKEEVEMRVMTMLIQRQPLSMVKGVRIGAQRKRRRRGRRDNTKESLRSLTQPCFLMTTHLSSKSQKERRISFDPQWEVMMEVLKEPNSLQ